MHIYIRGMGMHNVVSRTETREILRDMVDCKDFHELAERLGFVPASGEVEEMEHRESHLRCDALAPVMHDLLMAASVAGALLTDLAEGTPEACESTMGAAHRVALAVVAHLVDRGLLEVVV